MIHSIKTLIQRSFIAPAQFIIVLDFQPPLRQADNVILTQETIRATAQSHSRKALFLPRSHASPAPGDGLHLHFTFDQMTAFGNGKLELSTMGSSFVEGILHHTPALLGITLPTNNSLRRVWDGISTGNRIGWAVWNKAATLRLYENPTLGTLCLEFRLCDNTCNVYLALAAILFCGYDGIRCSRVLSPSLDEDSKRVSALPESFERMTANLKENELLIDLLGPAIASKYLSFRCQETDRSEISTLEIEVAEALKNA